MTLNIVRSFEFDPGISAYQGIHGASFNFRHHPIAPAGTKVLTWDAPDHRGSWADHGVPAVYLGPAMNHFRAYEVWVPNTSASRITNTVWWFMHDVTPGPDLLAVDPAHAYPPDRHCPDPKPNGADLIGRVFMEPEIIVCQITGLGPVTYHRMPSRAQAKRQKASPHSETISLGAHYTLTYQQTSSGEEHYSSLAEILQWIEAGPILQQPASHNATDAPITTPVYVPATLQYVPIRATPSIQPRQVEKQRVSDLNEIEKQRVSDLNEIEKQRVSDLNEINRTEEIENKGCSI